jgi:Ca-activated chloride channel homolog
MNFQYLTYWPAILAFFILLLSIVLVLERKFFALIKTYWFYKRSLLSYFATGLFLSGIGLLLFAVLDIRGAEEKIKTQVPSDRTIILLDTSASMLAEDVKPSRLHKAVLIAKHFARKAAGHQISIVAFAEIQKQILPFTSDLDLIDARLESLKNLRNHYGSSALSAALQESVQYLRDSGDSPSGNIIVLTDGEETAESMSLGIPKEVRVAFVAIGTTQGGRIPLDDARGFRFGYKKSRGLDVITKLDENFFKVAVNDIPAARYWLTNTYSLPSDEIVDFFISEKTKNMSEQDMVVRPVLMEWVVVPAIVLLILSYTLKIFRIFTLGLLLVTSPGWGKNQDVELSSELIGRLGQLQKGKLDHMQRLKLADDLYKEGLRPEALTLYKENLNTNQIDPNVPPEAYLNYGTGLLEKGETVEGLNTYERLMESLESRNEKFHEINNIMKKNIVRHFQVQEQKEQQKKDQKDKDKDKDKDNNDNNDEQQGQQGQGSGSKSGQDQDPKNEKKQQPQDGDEEKPDKDQGKNDDQKDKKDKSNHGDQDQDSDTADEDNDDGNDPNSEGNKDKPPLQKLPAKLKQLMSDDRQLQMQIIEHGTRDLNKRKSRTSKDW